MLAAIGVKRLEDLFSDVPEHGRFPDLDLPRGRSELEVERELSRLASDSARLTERPHLGQALALQPLGDGRFRIEDSSTVVKLAGEPATLHVPASAGRYVVYEKAEKAKPGPDELEAYVAAGGPLAEPRR